MYQMTSIKLRQQKKIQLESLKMKIIHETANLQLKVTNRRNTLLT